MCSQIDIHIFHSKDAIFTNKYWSYFYEQSPDRVHILIVIREEMTSFQKNIFKKHVFKEL